MKQYLILGLVAMGLFGVSAALSVWLNRSPTTTEEKSHADDKSHGEDVVPKKAGSKDKDHEPAEKEKDKGHATAPSRPLPKSEGGHDSPSVADPAGLRGREERLERRQAQVDLILRDLQTERENVDALTRQVTTEAKEAATRPPEPEPKAAAAKKDLEAEAAADRKNIDQLARLYDAMAPDSAAPILKQMADSGRLDTTVRILAQMKDRQAAQVLAAMSDPSLAAQISDKIRVMRRPSLAPPPNPGGSP